MKAQGYGIVRTDIDPDLVDTYVEAIRRLAEELGVELRGIFEEGSDASLPMLLARIGTSRTTVIFVPSVAHVTGWMDVIRQTGDAWTLEPRRCWRRLAGREAAER
ncbi:hypothetical protein GZH49_29360 [Nocardia terpenica]|uniref:hypothetical protein n=1 Tax=Nocardia terpenica TaxID=455432 RepID=UPI002FDFD46C